MSIFCAFSLCRRTYNISPPIFKYRMGVECKDIFTKAILRDDYCQRYMYRSTPY